AGEAQRLVQLSENQPIADRQSRLFNPEVGLGDLVLVELAESNSLTVQGCANMLQAMQRDKSGINSVTRPAKRRAAESLADVRARLARADRCEHLLADNVF